uniref:sigma-70 family RNA polymerase sigma factor n=1 Tax=Acetatifactor sp. TaxID=1872090 RepID=UPI0040575DEE
MNITTASTLIEENLHTIFAWSLSKLYDKNEAEDLTQDIICAVLKSVHRLERDEAFWGFVWKIAENTLGAKLRKKHPDTVEWDEQFCGAYWVTPEDAFMKSEEIQLLRRELSLLSNQYREVTVRYYIYGKSCSKISTELNISEEMVKYYLFKTRKILKEGIGMIREYGEKSYNPQTFRMDFWGGDGNMYWKLFERKLPGNILLAAYDKPVSITELSMELGVATAYLEDEITILEKHEFLKKIGDKYQTNIIIFTDEYEKRVHEKFKPFYQKTSESLSHQLDLHLAELRKLDFYGKHYDDNRLKWTLANLVMYHARCKSDDLGREQFGEYPPLSNGSFGFIFGYDNDYANHHFNGIYGYCENHEKTAWVSVENYRMIEKCQNLQPHKWEDCIRAMTDAALFKDADEDNEQLIHLINEGIISSNNGRLFPNFPVFSDEVFHQLEDILSPMIEETCKCMIQICNVAEETLKNYVPKALKDKCGQLSRINYQMNTMALIIEEMAANGQLTIPDERTNLCMFGVTRI